MKEKKLTDEQIIKAYKCCFVDTLYCDECPCNDWGCAVNHGDILDLIHRLQAEKEELKNEYVKLDLECQKLKTENDELKSPKFASWKLKFFKAQEEIERLTNENGQLNAYVNGLEYEREEYENMHAEIILLNNEKFELQKQVDELIIKNENAQKALYNYLQPRKEIEMQAVKDTAKEILIPLIDCEKQIDPLQTGIRWSVLKGFCKKFGVEVE